MRIGSSTSASAAANPAVTSWPKEPRKILQKPQIPSPENIIALISEKEILELVDQLPTGYRTIFNLYVIEGYKHREIAEKLGISINTSKSQLILAKKKMQILLKKNKILKQA